MTIADIQSTQWQLSVAGPGQVVQGVDDINQCIATILCCSPGSDPLRPLFGCDLPILIDQPANVSGPQIAAAMDKALRVWEPRIRVVKITYKIMNEQILFGIEWILKVGFGQGQTDLLLGVLDNLLLSPLFEDITPYLSAVLTTEGYDPLTAENGALFIPE